MHSLLALSFILLPIAVYGLTQPQQRRVVLSFGVPGAVLAIVLYLIFIAGNIQRPGFMSFAPGLSARGPIDWLYFWAMVWGPMIPLAVLGLVWAWPERSKNVRLVYLGFFLLFGVANLIQFQPTRWDNSKMFLWVYVGFAAMAVEALSRLWVLGWLWRGPVIVLAFCLTATGMVQTADLQNVERHTYRLLSTEQMLLTEEIREKTPPLARFTASFSHDHPISVWAARPVLLGYLSWVDNFGMEWKQLEKEVRRIYEGGPESAALLKKNRVDFVYLGPAEKREFKVNEEYFKKTYPVAFQTADGSELVYRVVPNQ